ncbi:MAG: HD domain-containing protein [Chloroflexota bacterium]|nr:HD domain-containing protein [Chloroflexota bacterium]
MVKNTHEIRDAIHTFIQFDSHERKIIDSRPFQRLRHINQLALTNLVYPGATHKRFEHSLGVMHLADRIFGVVTLPEHVGPEVREVLPELSREDDLRYWRKVLRAAALCHDLGHLPFSHAGEKEGLLPKGWTHENLTVEFIRSQEMREIWEALTPPLRPDDIAKLAVGAKEGAKIIDSEFTDWQAILADIIVGDAFGADRMDYLLRDSHHIGVAYGKFDHYRLIDTLRILRPPPTKSGGQSHEPTLGIEEGGLHSIEALLLARYAMFSQVYFHRVRRIYDIHLRDFLKEWLCNGQFSTAIEDLFKLTDVEVTQALRQASLENGKLGALADRIIRRQHFKAIYERNPDDIKVNPDAALAIYTAASEEFGAENVRKDQDRKGGGDSDFPVLSRDGSIISSLTLSQILENIPEAAIDYVFVEPRYRDNATKWLEKNRRDIIESAKEEVSESTE